MQEIFSFCIFSNRRDDSILPWRKHSYSPTPKLPRVCCEYKWFKIYTCTLLSTWVLVCWVVKLSSPESLTVSELVSRAFTTCLSNSTIFLAKMLLSSSYFSASCTAMFDLRRRHAFSSRNWAVCDKLQTHNQIHEPWTSISLTWHNWVWVIYPWISWGIWRCFAHKRNIMHDEKNFVRSSLWTKEGISWDRKCTSF